LLFGSDVWFALIIMFFYLENDYIFGDFLRGLSICSGEKSLLFPLSSHFLNDSDIRPRYETILPYTAIDLQLSRDLRLLHFSRILITVKEYSFFIRTAPHAPEHAGHFPGLDRASLIHHSHHGARYPCHHAQRQIDRHRISECATCVYWAIRQNRMRRNIWYHGFAKLFDLTPSRMRAIRAKTQESNGRLVVLSPCPMNMSSSCARCSEVKPLSEIMLRKWS
jgi:hypothetical protein